MRVDLGPEAEVPEAGIKCATADSKKFALFKVQGKVYCLDNTCTHLGGPLCEGRLNAHVVQCPWHGSRFDVRTGGVIGAPAHRPVTAYPVTVEGGRILANVS